MNTHLDRRHVLALAAASLGTGGLATGAGARPAQAAMPMGGSGTGVVMFQAPAAGDIARALQATIDRLGDAGGTIILPPGRHRIGAPVRLKPRIKLIAASEASVLAAVGAGRLMANHADGVTLSGFRIEAAGHGAATAALIDLNACRDVLVAGVEVTGGAGDGIRLWRSAGRIEACRLRDCGQAAISAGDSAGLVIQDNDIAAIANNGIVVWREQAGPDGTQILANRISGIRAAAGGSGQNGNAINAFRADHVLIANNTIDDCAYSAVRCNSASNVQIVTNNCRDIGEVALYAEFAFEGAIIANNLVARAATGISVTNFNDGGRLASVTGNVVRDLVRREAEPVDKRGVGISVEADTVVANNTIENAPTTGIAIGWGPHLRDIVAQGNLIRHAAVGIALSSEGPAASAVLTGNVIRQASAGAVRLHDHGAVVGAPARPDQSRFGPAVLSANQFD